jgi:phosphoglycolate phosphatase
MAIYGRSPGTLNSRSWTEVPRSLRGLLFDKDGTLLDYAASWIPINAEAADLAARGDARLAAHLLQVGGADPVTGRVSADSVLAAGATTEIAAVWVAAGAPYDAGSLTAAIDELFRRSAANVVPVTDLAALFARLKARSLKLGIASSDNEAAIRATTERFGIADLVDFVAGYDSGFGKKPDPGMFFAFCGATGLVPGEVAMIGDNNHDLRMGRAGGAGLTIAVLTGTGTRESLAAESDLCLGSIAELEAALFESVSG